MKEIQFPIFIKSVIPKQIQSRIYKNKEDIINECIGLDHETQLITSEIFLFDAEVRSFVLHGNVKTCSSYDGICDINEANEFIQVFTKSNKLPETCVLDIGFIQNKGWAVVEANATWGAGLNGCNPSGAAECIVHATTHR